MYTKYVDQLEKICTLNLLIEYSNFSRNFIKKSFIEIPDAQFIFFIFTTSNRPSYWTYVHTQDIFNNLCPNFWSLWLFTWLTPIYKYSETKYINTLSTMETSVSVFVFCIFIHFLPYVSAKPPHILFIVADDLGKHIFKQYILACEYP